ncbi:hypothetical protein [Massilia aquatica]|uniref:Secreted protein n=1 Tax=Massilia aquatica TaxID=2609000 RepID=A0ABX0M8I2_9BURK|nr:hypothetical protein [Massilia aquatica]NHZ41305.1 hypothetical protein [Massilia aquatica]
MNKLLLAMGLLTLGSAGLASAAQDAPAPTEQATPAGQAAPTARAARKARVHTRLRIIDDARVDVRFYRNSTCPHGDGVIATNNASRQAGMFRSNAAVSIGIPETPSLEAMKARMGPLLSKAAYREFVLTPGQPVALQAGYMSVTRVNDFTCPFPSYTFVPDQGIDYEMSTGVADGLCWVALGRIDMSEGRAKVVPMTLDKSANCAAAR